MSTRTRRNKNSRIGRGKWKLIDDRSGFELRSEDAWIDHRGRITSKSNWDPIHYTEMVIDFPPENSPLPFMRPEPQDSFITTSLPSYGTGSGFELPPSTWGPNTNSYVWNIVRFFWNSDIITWNEDPSPPHTASYGDEYDYWTDDTP